MYPNLDNITCAGLMNAIGLLDSNDNQPELFADFSDKVKEVLRARYALPIFEYHMITFEGNPDNSELTDTDHAILEVLDMAVSMGKQHLEAQIVPKGHKWEYGEHTQLGIFSLLVVLEVIETNLANDVEYAEACAPLGQEKH